ncbi:MAG: hypothetical protein H0S85_12875 [Desulfovibrionaceae bacterium]|jgi:hypothetical protein|nr:hypothetical protein [Desulfovibrionaceae bacterium]
MVQLPPLHEAAYDAIVALHLVHGGSWHKLIRFVERLRGEGLRAALLVSRDAPLGLQEGVDFDAALAERLAGLDVHVVSMETMRAVLDAVPCRVVLFCGGDDTKGAAAGHRLRDLAALAHARGARTLQFSYVIDDFQYAGTTAVVLPHPVTLWFVLRHYRRHSCRDLPGARRIFFGGNLLAAPVCNAWTSTVADRASLFAKYGLDPERPTCLWLPNRSDGATGVYGAVLDAVRGAGMNLLVKLHPWEYKNKVHKFDPRFGGSATSADKWGCAEIEERDGSWAQRFCDVAVVAGSSVALEMPFWERPVAYVDPFYWCFGFVRSCAVRLDRVDQLGGLLAGPPPHPSPEDYAAARGRMQPPGDAVELHVEAVKEVLEMPSATPPIGSMAEVERLFAGKVPWYVTAIGRRWDRVARWARLALRSAGR